MHCTSSGLRSTTVAIFHDPVVSASVDAARRRRRRSRRANKTGTSASTSASRCEPMKD